MWPATARRRGRAPRGHGINLKENVLLLAERVGSRPPLRECLVVEDLQS